MTHNLRTMSGDATLNDIVESYEALADLLATHPEYAFSNEAINFEELKSAGKAVLSAITTRTDAILTIPFLEALPSFYAKVTNFIADKVHGLNRPADFTMVARPFLSTYGKAFRVTQEIGYSRLEGLEIISPDRLAINWADYAERLNKLVTTVAPAIHGEMDSYTRVMLNTIDRNGRVMSRFERGDSVASTAAVRAAGEQAATELATSFVNRSVNRHQRFGEAYRNLGQVQEVYDITVAAMKTANKVDRRKLLSQMEQIGQLVKLYAANIPRRSSISAISPEDAATIKAVADATFEMAKLMELMSMTTYRLMEFDVAQTQSLEVIERFAGLRK